MKKIVPILMVLAVLVSFSGCELIMELLGIADENRVATPVIDPQEGEYTEEIEITMICADGDAIIFYTLDGSIPTAGSIRYEGPFMLTSSATIKAIAIIPGRPDSEIAEWDYILTFAETGNRVVMIYVDDADDGVFNDVYAEMADAALEQAVIDDGIIYESVWVEMDGDYDAVLTSAAEDGADLVLGIGWMFGMPIQNVAGANPDTTFVGIDAYVDFSAPDNAVGLMFAQQEGAFLAGVVAAAATQTDVVGVVLGEDIGPVQNYYAGFYAGVKTVSPSAMVPVIWTDAFDDFSAGVSAAQTLIGGGADVIFHAAGLTGAGALAEAESQGFFGIGVDYDQSPEYTNTVITSVVKNIDVVVAQAVDEFLAGTLGDLGGGTTWRGLGYDWIGLAPLREFTVPPYLEDEVDAVAQDIIDGVLYCPWHIDQVFRIGVVGDRSGSLFNYGNAAYRAVTLMASSANYSSGLFDFFVALEVEDDQADSSPGGLAETAAARMVAEGVHAVIGHTTSAATDAALSAVYAAANIPVISPSASMPYLTDGTYSNFYRTIGIGAQFFEASFANTDLGVTDIGILYNSDYGWATDNKDRLTAAMVDPPIGGTVGFTGAYTAGNYGTVIADLVASGVEAVVFYGDGTDGAALFNALRVETLTMPFISGLGRDGDFLSSVPADPVELYIRDYVDPANVPEGQGEITEHVDIYGEEPAPFFLNAYAAAQALVWTVATMESVLPADIYTGLETLVFEDTALGTIEFDVEGDVSGGGSGFEIDVISGGEYVLY